MPVLSDYLQAELSATLQRAYAAQTLGALSDPADLPEVKITVPNDISYGDYASPVALGMAKLCKLAPAKIAAAIQAEWQHEAISLSVAGPGYLNFSLSASFLQQALEDLFAQGNAYGQTSTPTPEHILLEYVSANPTGPLHVGHGRWAAIGSTLANLLRWSGHSVDREYYINDAGNQMQLLGKSLQVRYQQLQGEAVELPEDCYRGEYLKDLAASLDPDNPAIESVAALTDFAYGAILAQQQDTLAQFRTIFERWFSERVLHTPDPATGLSAVDQTLQELEANGFTYRAGAARQDEAAPNKAEAVFFQSADWGDDKDRVVVKDDGSRTYLAADIAYHRDKLRRGYDRLINIWGADHHGYIARVKAAVAAFGLPPEKLEVLLGQFVKLFRTNPETQKREEVRMSKRSGNFVSLNDLIDDPEFGVGVDAARWFLISNTTDTPINFDLDLAVKQSNDNPVFYVQYAHTRCCSLLKLAEAATGLIPGPIATEAGELYCETTEERILLLQLLNVPEALRTAALERSPHKVTRLAENVATAFHKFYDHCRILGPVASETPALASARLSLVAATRQVLFNLLEGVLGISAPTEM